MEKLSVAQARQAESPAARCSCKAGFARAATPRGASAFSSSTTARRWPTSRSSPKRRLPNYESEVKHLAAGCSVTVEGLRQGLARQGAGHRSAGQRRSSCTAGPIPRRYPLQKKRHSFEFLRTIAHLRPRTNTFGAIARVRNCVSRSIHNFFQEEGFLYIHPPIITASDCEGAGEMFKVTTLDLAKVPKQRPAGRLRRRTSSIGPAYLTVSGQLEGEIFACALGKVYTFGPTFRAENSNTSRHLAEFWMVEPEMAFFELADNMDLAEAVFEADLSRRARAMPPRTWSCSTSTSTRP